MFNKKNALKAVSTAVLATMCMAGVTGCSTNQIVVPGTSSTTENQNYASSGQIAASSNDVTLSEEEVANYISQYRTYTSTTDKESFATLLDEAGVTVEQFRAEVIAQLMARKLAFNEAQKQGIEVTEAEIDDYIDQVKDDLEYLGSGTSWSTLLDITGYDEESYRNDIKYKMTLERLVLDDIGGLNVSEADMLAYANNNPLDYIGANVIIIDFSASQKQAARTLASDGNDTSVREFRDLASAAVDSGKATQVSFEGWTCVETPSSMVMSAIANLTPGQTAVVNDNDGITRVVYVESIYSVNKNGRLSYDDMPSEIKAKLEGDAKSNAVSIAVSNYLEKLIENENVEVFDMPNDAPYAVALSNSAYGVESDETNDENISNASSEQVANMEK